MDTKLTKAENILVGIYEENSSGGTLNRNSLCELSGFSKKKVMAVMKGLVAKGIADISISRGAGWMIS